MDSATYYHPDAGQRELAAAFGETIAGLLPVSRLRKDRTERSDVFDGLRDAGLFALAVSEAAGGSGLGAAEEALIVAAVGKQLAGPDVLATIAASPLYAGSTGSADPMPRVAAAYRMDGRTIIVDSGDAAWILLREENRAMLHRRPAVMEPIDEGSWLSHLSATDAPGETIAAAEGSEMLRLRLIDAAALGGIAERALEMAVAYAKVREQFGRPIGTFQAVQHHAANMAIAARCARDQVAFAAVALDRGRSDAALQVESALLTAGKAALENAGLNIQIHGGLGFSDEAEPHLCLKRARVILAIAGGLEAAAERIAAIPPLLAAELG